MTDLGGEGSKWARTDMRSRSLLKASDCFGPHNHGWFLCVILRIGSVIAARFGTKRATVLTNPRKRLASVAVLGGCICLIACMRFLSGDIPCAESVESIIFQALCWVNSEGFVLETKQNIF